MQYDSANRIIYATKTGGKCGQISMFLLLVTYFLKGNSIKLRFFYGFLYGYWAQHFYTLGSYAGVLFTLPKVYRNAYKYFDQRPNEHNYLAQLEPYFNKNIENTQGILDEIFDQKVEQKTFTVNQFFVKNWDKYMPKQNEFDPIARQKQLKYVDCFLTRYIYYGFSRWWNRVGQFVGFRPE